MHKDHIKPGDICYKKNKAGRKGDKGKTRSLNEMRKQTSSLTGKSSRWKKNQNKDPERGFYLVY